MDVAAIEALASTASAAVVTAAATDLFEGVRHRVAALFGRGKPDPSAAQRLDATRERVTNTAPGELEAVRARQAAQWQTRFTDLLTDDPGVEAGLCALVEDLSRALPATATASDHSLAVARDVTVQASSGSVAAGVIHGNVVLAGERERVGVPVRLAPRPGELAGREELLATLHDMLSGGPDVRVVALHGLGGAGKTSVAVEYAHRHRAVLGVTWQFAAEDHVVMETEFARLSELLAAAGGLATPADPVGSVHAVLAASPVPWLLIFDNAPDWASVRDFLPGGGNGQVLITSQHGLWRAGQGVEVPVLDVETAALFLVSRSGDPDLTTARKLAAELGGLPLALEQAAAYALAAGLSLGAYLGIFQARRAELLDRGEVTDHPATVTATIGLALTRLEEQAPAAAGLLRLLACLAPEPVPVSLLLSRPGLVDDLDPDVGTVLGPLLNDPIARTDAIAALRRYSLITPAGNEMIAVHRLAQGITLDLAGAVMAERWRHAADILTEAAIPDDTTMPATWPTCAALLPHAQAVLNLTSGGMSRMAGYLGDSGSPAAARDLFRRIASAREHSEVYGAEHRDTMFARHKLARWTGEAGDLAGARDLLTVLLPDMERILGPEHPDTLSNRHELARFTGDAGDTAGARDLLAALLSDMERVLGPEHTDTLATRHGLATYTGRAGNAIGARDLCAALLPVRERVLGAEHPDTLATWHEFAAWIGQAGDTAEARDQYAALLCVKERALGPEHPSTLITQHQLATYTGRAGDAAKARDLFTVLLPMLERVLGPEHPDTLAAQHQLADYTGRAGEVADARDRYATLLPMMERVLGPEHPNTLTTQHQLAAYTGRAGDVVGARAQYATLLPVMERILGPKHLSTLAARHQLADFARDAGDAVGAQDR